MTVVADRPGRAGRADRADGGDRAGRPGRADRLRFTLRPQLEAPIPPEARGITRDAVRMMVAYRGDQRLVHATFSDLPRFLDAGDLVVVNTSGTLAAAIDARAAGRGDGDRDTGDTGDDVGSLSVHLSTRLPAGLWVIELRRAGQPFTGGHPGMVLALPGGGAVEVLAPYVRPASPRSPADSGRAAVGAAAAGPVRLWVASLRLPSPLLTYLAAHGRPIRYGYVQGDWPISMYQNVYATEPGSAEMPSAGRPFTPEVVTRLVAKGVGVAPLVLHTGVSSLEAHEAPYAELFRVPAHTARVVNETRREGGRVVAVGTTVVRALETAADERGRVHPADGWTETIVTPERGVRAVDGLLTGWHEPEASHLDMLDAIAGRELVERSYEAALAEGYLWHEFGDVHLVLP